MVQYNVGIEDNSEQRHSRALGYFWGTFLVSWAGLALILKKSTYHPGLISLPISILIGFFVYHVVSANLKGNWQKSFERRQKFKEKIDSTGFVFGKIFDSPEMVFMVSEDLSQALYIDKDFKSHSFSSTDIKAVSVVVDEQTISNFTTGAGGSLAGAGVGGLMFGGVGAIVGAVAGKKQKAINEVKIKSVQIKLAVSKAGSNLVILDFFKSNEGVSKDDTNLQKALANVDEWWATFTVMSDSKN